MSWRFWISIIFILSIRVEAASKKSEKTDAETSVSLVNVVLFSDLEESWTLRDYQLFAILRQEALKKNKLSQYSDHPQEDFLMSRLVAREGRLFDMTPSEIALTDSIKRKISHFTADEIKKEIEWIGYAVAMTDIKENQLKQKLRYRTWIEALKKKYQVKIKWNYNESKSGS